MASLVPTVASAAASSSSPISNEKNNDDEKKNLASSSSGRKLRLFTMNDHARLQEMCRNVYGGRDYLPHIARQLVEDPESQFWALVEEEEDDDDDDADSTSSSTTDGRRRLLLAVANVKRLCRNSVWLEAVRTCPNHRNQGLATTLLQSILVLLRRELHDTTTAADNKTILWTCTVSSNTAMIQVLQRVGGMTRLSPYSSIHQLQFPYLLNLPGWSKQYTEEGTAKAQPLLQAMQLTEWVPETAKKEDYYEWIRIESMEELNQALKSVQRQGGMGRMPGLYELLSTRQLQKALDEQHVWTKRKRKTTTTIAANATTSTTTTTVLAFVEDIKIQSLRSRRVLSVASTSVEDVEAALWFACCCREEYAATPFVIAIDGAVDIHSSRLCSKLPFVEDPCVLFGTSAVTACNDGGGGGDDVVSQQEQSIQ